MTLIGREYLRDIKILKILFVKYKFDFNINIYPTVANSSRIVGN